MVIGILSNDTITIREAVTSTIVVLHSGIGPFNEGRNSNMSGEMIHVDDYSVSVRWVVAGSKLKFCRLFIRPYCPPVIQLARRREHRNSTTITDDSEEDESR